MHKDLAATPEERLAAVLAVATRACAARPPTIERTSTGLSTEVYRCCCGGAVLYLRLLPEEGASYAPEVLAHELLRQRGARVPEVVYWEDREPRLRCSVMVVREVPGKPLEAGATEAARAAVLVAAGRDLAIVNSFPVQGFGWVRRDAGSGEALRAESDSFAEWALAELDAALATLERQAVLPAAEVAAVRQAVARGRALWGDPPTAVLAHGDFDGSHIYCDGGAYSGTIDFGEIRGADPWYDLAHFQIEHPTWLPLLLSGYREAAPLPADAEQRIHYSTLILTGRRLALWLAKGRRPHRLDLEAIPRALAALA